MVELRQIMLPYYCPRCDTRDARKPDAQGELFHNCPGLSGMSVPMVRTGHKAKVSANVREDYLGNGSLPGDYVTDAAGQPISSISTETEDGISTVVYAPTARGIIH